MTELCALRDTEGMMTGLREHQLFEAANTLMDARRTSEPIAELPPDQQPTSVEEAYVVQDRMAWMYGEIGGWKIGASTPDATPVYAPMPHGWIAGSGAILYGPTYRYRGLEAEIAFLLGEDLPPRDTPYTREEVLDAIASCHPAIEELESGLVDPKAVPKFQQMADLQMNGGFIYGPAVDDWRSIDFSAEKVTLSIDGTVRVERTGSNTSGDLLRLLPYLANEGAARTGGLRAGQWITTGSWTSVTLAEPGARVDVRFEHAGEVYLRFEM